MPALLPCTGTVAVGTGVRLRLVAMAMAGEAELVRAGSVHGFQSNRTPDSGVWTEIRQWCLMSNHGAICEPGHTGSTHVLREYPYGAQWPRDPFLDAEQDPF